MVLGVAVFAGLQWVGEEPEAEPEVQIDGEMAATEDSPLPESDAPMADEPDPLLDLEDDEQVAVGMYPDTAPLLEDVLPQGIPGLDTSSSAPLPPLVDTPEVEEQKAEQILQPFTVQKKSFVASIRHLSATGQAERSYRQAQKLLQRGRVAEPVELLQHALAKKPEHIAARQLLSRLMLESGRRKEAHLLLGQGVLAHPEHEAFRMGLARLDLAQGNESQARELLQQGLGDTSSAAYRAFYATLLQRARQYPQATEHYLAALQRQPDNAGWLLGLAVTLQANGERDEAMAAYQRALQGGRLDQEMQDYARQQLRMLGQ